MASVSILYLDWNFIYFITKACLKFVLASSQLGRGGERGGGNPGPRARCCSHSHYLQAPDHLLLVDWKEGGTMLANGVTLVTGHYEGMQSNSLWTLQGIVLYC